MKIGQDRMKITTKCSVTKNKKNMRKGVNMEFCDCEITSSVTAGIIRINIPEKNTELCIRTQDILEVMNASNQKYMELRQKE